MKFVLFVLHAATVLAAAVIPQDLKPRADFCGQWDTATTTNGYIIYNNLWGMSAGTGSQCTGLDSASSNTVAWHTSWTWSGGSYNVKSYANANKVFTPKTLSAISSLPAVMKYTYTGTSMVANVAFDIFLAPTSGASSSAYEIMIWLAALGGAGPISSSGSPIATVTIAGTSWNLYDGYNGSMRVFSFVAASQVTSFSADLKLFLTYLATNNGLATSQYVNTIQAGTEPFTGSGAKLTVSAFSVAYN